MVFSLKFISVWNHWIAPPGSAFLPGDLLEKRQWRLHRGSATGPWGLSRQQHVPWLRETTLMDPGVYTCGLWSNSVLSHFIIEKHGETWWEHMRKWWSTTGFQGTWLLDKLGFGWFYCRQSLGHCGRLLEVLRKYGDHENMCGLMDQGVKCRGVHVSCTNWDAFRRGFIHKYIMSWSWVEELGRLRVNDLGFLFHL